MSLSPGRIAILDKEAAQFAALPLVVGNLALIAGYVMALFVPWVRARVAISLGYFNVNLPVDVGLLRCFSKICDDYADLIYDDNGVSSSLGNNLSLNRTLLLAATAVQPLPPLPVPVHDTPVVATPSTSAGGSMHSLMDEELRRTIDDLKRPYFLASRISVPLLTCAVVLCVFSVVITFFMVFTKRRLFFHHQLTVLLVALIANASAIVCYMTITMPHLNNGDYLDGTWVSILVNGFGVLCCLMSIVITDDSFGCCTKYRAYPYKSLPYNGSDDTRVDSRKIVRETKSIPSTTTVPLVPHSNSDKPMSVSISMGLTAVDSLEAIPLLASKRGHTNTTSAYEAAYSQLRTSRPNSNSIGYVPVPMSEPALSLSLPIEAMTDIHMEDGQSQRYGSFSQSYNQRMVTEQTVKQAFGHFTSIDSEL